MIKLDYLRYFKAAADAGSFSAAEKTLFVSVTSIVRAVDILEQQLEAQLFIRKPSQGLTLTKEGKRLLTISSRLLSDFQDLESEFRNDKTLSGELVLGCPDGLAWSLTPLLLERINAAYPELETQLRILSIAESMEQLAAGTVDVLLTFETQPAPADIAIEQVAQASPYAMMSASHPLAKHEKLTLKQVGEYPQITLDDGPSYQFYVEQFRSMGAKIDVRLRTGSSIVSWSLVSVTDMLALRHIKPQHNLSPLGKEIACVPIKDNIPKTNVIMGWRKNMGRQTARKVAFFAESCRQLVAEGKLDPFIFTD